MDNQAINFQIDWQKWKVSPNKLTRHDLKYAYTSKYATSVMGNVKPGGLRGDPVRLSSFLRDFTPFVRLTSKQNKLSWEQKASSFAAGFGEAIFMPIALLLYPITGTLNPLASLRSWLGAGDMVEKKSTAYWTGDMIGIFADGGLAARMLVGLFKFSKTAITCWKRGDSLFDTLRIEREFAQAQREIAKARKAEQKRLPKAQKTAQKENPLGVYGMHEYDYPKDYFGEQEILEKINEMERKYVKETGHQIQPYADRGLHGVDDATYGKIDPLSGQIYLFDYKKENLFAKAEELLHYQQLKECNAIGKTEEELGSKFIEWMERDVVDRLEGLGFTKRRR